MKDKIKGALIALVTRSVVGLGLSLVAMALVLWHLGAEQYAPIVLAQALFFYASTVGSLGLDVVILRSAGAIPEEELEAVYLVQTCLSTVAVGIAALAGVLLFNLDVVLVGVVAASYVVRSLAAIPNARLESEMIFRNQAQSELLAQLAYILSLLFLFLAGLGVDAVAFGLLASAAIYSARVYLLRPIVPRLKAGIDISSHLRQGAVLQFNAWIWQLREPLIPVIFRMYGGDAFLGAYGMANQIAQKLGFLRQVIWRVAVPAIASTRCRCERVAGVRDATTLNVLMTSVIFLALVVVVHLLEVRIGNRWLGVHVALAAIGVHVILNSVVSIHCAKLVAEGRLRQLVAFHSWFVLVFTLALVTLAANGFQHALLLAEIMAASAYFYLLSVIRQHETLSGLGYPLAVAAIALCAISLGALYGTTLFAVAALAGVLLAKESRSVIGRGLRMATGRTGDT